MKFQAHLGAAAGLALLLASAAASAAPADVDWPTYAGDLAASRYKPLDQINAQNFNKLEVAWRFKTDAIGNRPEYKLEGTPLEVNGVVYATAGTRRASSRWTRRPANSCGCTASTKASAAPPLRASSPAAASPIGRTARATSASSISPPATS